MKTASQRVKKCYSISRQSERFVRQIRKARGIKSDSEALDQLLREAIAAHARGSIDAAYKAFYDAVSESELAEDTAWAAFSESELAEIAQ